jgi:hypothetical protein
VTSNRARTTVLSADMSGGSSITGPHHSIRRIVCIPVKSGPADDSVNTPEEHRSVVRYGVGEPQHGWKANVDDFVPDRIQH